MMNSSTKFLKALLLLVVAFWATSSSYADSPRKVVIEQFTSTTCGPCAAANPAFHDWISKNLDYVVPFIYHMNFPAPGDPMYLHNTTMNTYMQNYYAINSIPAACVNGAAPIHPATLGQQGYASIVALKGTISKVDMSIDVTNQGNLYTATITVKSSVALSNHQLRGVVIEHPIKYASAPGSNGETYFPWVPRWNMINSGIFAEKFTLAAGESKTFTYTFDKKGEWQDGKFTVSAYVQDAGTKEILQGESSAFSISSSIANRYLKTAPGAPVTGTVALSNPKTFDMNVTMTINKDASALPANWTATLSSNSTAVAKGASGNFNVIVTPAKGSYGLGLVAVDLKTTSGNKEGLTTTEYVYVLNTETKLGVYMSAGGNIAPIMQSWSSNAKYAKLPAFIPIDDFEAAQAYDASNFQAILIMEANSDYAFAANGPFVASVINALNNKKNVAVLSGFNFVASTATNQDGSFSIQVSDEGRQFFKDYAKVSLLGFYNLLQNNQLYYMSLTGVASDPISDNLPVEINRYNAQTFPYYIQYVPATSPTSPDAKPVYTADNGGTPVAVGVRREFNGGTRLVWLGYGLDVIADKSTRDVLLSRILEYIYPLQEVSKPVITVASSVSFPDTKVGETNVQKLEITNSGKAVLEITKLGLSFDDQGKDKFFTYDVKLPLKIQAGAKASISITFAPKEVNDYIDDFEITSNDLDSPVTSVTLSGKGISTTNIKKAQITSSTQAVSFGKVDINSTAPATVNLSNTGDEDLIINEISLNNLDGIFSVKAPSLPLTITSGKSYTLELSFTPTAAQTYNNILNIRSNSENQSDLAITLTGDGNNPTSVQDGLAGEENVFTYSVGPNPFENSAVISYNVAAAVGAQNITMNLVNSNGEIVKNLVNGQVEMGSYTMDITSTGIASGSYIIVTYVGNNIYTLPVTIKK